MRYLVLSDIHANLEALQAVLADTPPASVDRVLVLGDLVGYGPDPNAVSECIRALPQVSVIRGNHDKVACGLEPPFRFNHLARHAVEWTAAALTADNRTYLRSLPMGPLAVDDLIEICHGTPFNEDVYVVDYREAGRALERATRPLCLFGHTHVVAAFRLQDGVAQHAGGRTMGPAELALTGESAWLVNCGSVGQPRDGDWRAAFGVVDTDTRVVSLKRVPYAVAETQAKMRAAGLPEPLAERLSAGH